MSPIYSLVVCGGKSSRMGRDKSLLDYHGMPQRYYLFNLLEKACGKAYISCNTQQLKDIPAAYPTIADDPQYGAIGPMAAVLTAMAKYPDASFLAVGCDYPFLREQDIIALVAEAKASGATTAYYNASAGFAEPLLTVYQADIKPHLHKAFEEKQNSLRRVLERMEAYFLPHPHPGNLRSIDHPDDYEEAKELLSRAGRLS